MRGIKLISWIVGLSMVGGAVTTVPAVANDISGPLTNNQMNMLYGFEPLSFTATVDNALQGTLGAISSLTGSSRGQGFVNDGFSRGDLVTLLTTGSREQGSTNGVDGTLTQGGQNSSAGEVNSNRGQAGADGAAIEGQDSSAFSSGEENAVSEFLSADTESALLALSDRLQEIERGLWAYGDELDQSIRDSASGLSKDLAAAEARCQTDASKCDELDSLVKKTNSLLESLETLRLQLGVNVQKARIY